MEKSVSQRSGCLNTVNSCKACGMHTRTSGPISLSFEREFAKLQHIRVLDRKGVFRHTYPSKDYGGKLNTLIPLTETASRDEANVYQSDDKSTVASWKSRLSDLMVTDSRLDSMKDRLRTDMVHVKVCMHLLTERLGSLSSC
ncbi:hypothetical protein AVEN_27697-1 [Araneus ventricosus]|uniref:Uncharacterized protein n=1 Tax=Araneus ventricosus TaxID=182803 RepID=A0A4Y2MKZ3_ARAVE|nr:hypothetical protein AVEN_27697-1 [Araneus ventricosus]